MLIGYMRASGTDTQIGNLQRIALLAAGVDPTRLYEDHASGKHAARPGFDACIKGLRPGDTLVAWRLDRLGRDLRHLVKLAHDLTGRGVGLRVLVSEGTLIDTTAPEGPLVTGLFAALAEFERERSSECVRPGLPATRARGRHGGRPFKMSEDQLRQAQRAMAQNETSVGKLCAELRISRQTLYRHVDPNGRLRPHGEKLLRRGQAIRKQAGRSGAEPGLRND